MFVLKDCQREAVQNIYRDLLSNQKVINFQAPTGSGKTFILCSLCDEYLKHCKLTNQKCIIIFNTISTGNLQKQNYDKSVLYTVANGFEYDSYLISSPSSSIVSRSNKDINYSIPLTDQTVYFIGNASFKSKSILYERGELESFLKEAQREKYQIIYIRDEAHLGTKLSNDESKNIEQLARYFDKQIYVSATLTTKRFINVQISEKQAVTDGLIKGKLEWNKGLDKIDGQSVNSTELLDIAIEEFKKIKEAYQSLNNFGVYINPAMLIQVSSNFKGVNLDEQLESIIKQVEKAGLTYALYTSDKGLRSNTNLFGNSKEINDTNKKFLTQNNSLIDVIIFKVALATGWDIPRACMLVQLREIHSDTLNKQTIGRIRRNPMPNLVVNPITDKYYVYSNFNDAKTNKEYDYLLLKTKFKNLNFSTIKIKETKHRNTNVYQFINQLHQFFDDKNFSYLINTEYKAKYELNTDEDGNHFYPLKLDELSDNHHTNVDYIHRIYNLFEVYRFWFERLNKQDDYYELLNKGINEYCQKHGLSKTIFRLFLLHKDNEGYLNQINSLYNDLNDLSVYAKNVEVIDDISLPSFTIQEKSDYKYNFNKKVYDHVCYELAGYKEANTKLDYYFDSNPEKAFLEKLVQAQELKRIKLVYLTKNYLDNSDLKFEYILKDAEGFAKKARGYPDFILNCEDEQLNRHVYFVEIKSLDNDYDPAKTQSLIQAYKEYSMYLPYHFVLMKVKKEKGFSSEFQFIHFYKGEEYQSLTTESFAEIEKMLNNYFVDK